MKIFGKKFKWSSFRDKIVKPLASTFVPGAATVMDLFPSRKETAQDQDAITQRIPQYTFQPQAPVSPEFFANTERARRQSSVGQVDPFVRSFLPVERPYNPPAKRNIPSQPIRTTAGSLLGEIVNVGRGMSPGYLRDAYDWAVDKYKQVTGTDKSPVEAGVDYVLRHAAEQQVKPNKQAEARINSEYQRMLKRNEGMKAIIEDQQRTLPGPQPTVQTHSVLRRQK